jgi:hypothetical protein
MHQRRTGGSLVIGIGAGITTIGILLLVAGVVGASIEVYVQLLSAIVQQRLSAILEQLPAIIRPETGPPGGQAGPPFDSMYILRSLIEATISTPLWLALTVVGIGLIYSGLFITLRQRSSRRQV